MAATTAVLAEPDDTARRIREHCRERTDLIGDYEPREDDSVLTVLCYPLAEAYYFAKGKPGDLTPERRSHEGGSHWYLRRDDGTVIDLSLPGDRRHDLSWYDAGQPCGFLSHPNPSKRAESVLDALWNGE